MRLLIYTLALAFLPMLAQANHIQKDLEGYWENHSTHTTIKVDAKRYGFKIKGLYVNQRYTRFHRNHRGQYIDSRGNELKIKSRTRIVFHNRHNGLKTRFTKQHHRTRGYGYGRSHTTPQYDQSGGRYYNTDRQGYQDDGYYNDGYYKNGETRDRYIPKSKSQRNRLSYTPTRIDDSRLRSIEGTWMNYGSNAKKVIIVSTRDGIKVKDTTNDKWHRYKLSPDRKSLVDEKGNLYQMEGETLYWTANDSKRVLKLDKKSKNTF